MDVYFLVLNWNNLEDTSDCLRSLRAHEPDTSVVLIDNGSDPDELDVLRTRFPWVTVVRNETNLGFAGGNNPGIRLALDEGATHIGLLNNDTVLKAPVVERLVNTLESSEGAGAVSPAIRYCNGTEKVWSGGGRMLPMIPRPHYYDRLLDERNPYRVELLSGCAVLFKAEVFEEVGFLDDGFFFYQEDVDFSLRLRERGFELVVDPAVSVYHKVSRSTGGPHTPFAFYHVLRSKLRLMEKHRGRGLARVTAPAYLALLTAKMGLNALLHVERGRRRQVLGALGRAWRDWVRAR